MHYLYLITREDGKKYVGVTNNLARRMKEHNKGYGSKYLKNEIFTYEILEEGEEEYIYSLEDQAILNNESSLNIARGGSGGLKIDQTGSLNNQAKLSESEVLDIRNYAYNNPKISYDIIAEKYKVSRKTVNDICLGRDWVHVGGPIIEDKRAVSYPKKGTKEDILTYFQNGVTVPEITTLLGYNKVVIYKYLKSAGYELLEEKRSKKLLLMDEVKSIYLNSFKNWSDMGTRLGISRTTCKNYAKEMELLV